MVVSGTGPGNQRWGPSNVFTDATDITAPADNVLVMDTVRSDLPFGKVGIHFNSGTSLAAPMVAGTAALLLSMDPGLTPGQVKDYLLRGAQVSRYDSLNAIATVPPSVSGIPGVYQLDAYGSLSLLSKERSGTPVCGYPVSGRGPWLLLEKNGPLAPPTDSIKVPFASGALGHIGVAPGGRSFSAYAQGDSLNGGSQSVIYFNYLGQRLGATPNVWGGRHHAENHIVDHRQVNVGGGYQELTLRRSDLVPLTIMNLHYPDGTLATNVQSWDFDVSPDARFVTFRGTGGTYVQRYADNTTTLIGSMGLPRWSKSGTKLVSFASDTLGNYTYWVYAVDSTAHGGFTLTQTIPGSGRRLGLEARFSGDDALFYSSEIEQNPTRFFVAARAGGALGTKGSEAEVEFAGMRQIGNLIAKLGNRE